MDLEKAKLWAQAFGQPIQKKRKKAKSVWPPRKKKKKKSKKQPVAPKKKPVDVLAVMKLRLYDQSPREKVDSLTDLHLDIQRQLEDARRKEQAAEIDVNAGLLKQSEYKAARTERRRLETVTSRLQRELDKARVEVMEDEKPPPPPKPIKLKIAKAVFTPEQRQEIMSHWLYPLTKATMNFAWLTLMVTHPDFAELAKMVHRPESELIVLYTLYLENTSHKEGSFMPEEVTPRFILPPHPKSGSRLRRQDLPAFEAMGKFIAQRKFNGTHVVIWIYKDLVVLWDRRGITLTYYQLTKGMTKCLLGLNRDPEKELVVCGECLNTKAKSKITGEQAATDTIVLFDVIYYGDHLTQMSQVERLAFLAQLCGNPTQLEAGSFFGATKRALVVRDEGTSHLWLAEVFTEEFDYHFDECDDEDAQKRDKYPEIEGLILRMKDSKLRAGGTGDVDWLIRVRKRKEGIYTM